MKNIAYSLSLKGIAIFGISLILLLYFSTITSAQVVVSPLDSSNRMSIHTDDRSADTIFSPPDTAGKNQVYEYVEHMPEFPGGTQGLMRYLQQKVKYPGKARRKNIQGTVIVRFVIAESGDIEDIETVGKKLGGGLEKEAMRVVKRMPRWKPGVQKGKKVRVQYSLPIRFQLTN